VEIGGNWLNGLNFVKVEVLKLLGENVAESTGYITVTGELIALSS